MLTLFWWIIAVTFLVSPLSKIHILWVAPAAFVISFVLSPPMGVPILSPVLLVMARIFVHLVSLGVENPKQPKD